MEQNAEIGHLIKTLHLKPHPEGGYYAETYRSGDSLVLLPGRYPAPRTASTAIYFLLPAGTFSAFHRIQSDEGWHFYQGQPLRIHMLLPDGTYQYHDLGPDLVAGQTFQYFVPHGTWFASEPIDKEGYSLVGCTVAPGFDFEDFEMAKAAELKEQFPTYSRLITRLCRI